ncbi:tetratricopeptide repeat protein [Nitratidesulfovibrio sp. HK-II]|uniref:tetratricopeptide repeat protein n=1 Tax=Nitratidesulfovibrio sp. HK-II TaxID=2009266 RepID=UPI000E2F96EC|nr:tetratricopeptide repeat protein [Nitratidesulfovibrio sp. HK-II]
MHYSGRALPGRASGPATPPSARLRAGLPALLCGIALLLATAATAHAASTVTAPFGGGLRKESAIVIARSAARLAALREGVAPLLEGSAAASFATLAAHDPQRRLAVASAVLVTRVTDTRVEGYPPEVRVAVTVQATLPDAPAPAPSPGLSSESSSETSPDISNVTPSDDIPHPSPAGAERVRAVLRDEALLELHEDVLRREAALTEEALDAAQATARHVARHGGEDESPFAQRLGALARSLEALELYRACLSGIPVGGDTADKGNPPPQHSAAENGIGSGWGGWGAPPEAMLRHMRRAVALDARNPLLWNALGEALLLLDRPQDAMEAQDRALKLSPGFARALHARAVCHLRLQMPALAVEDASAAIRLRPDVAAHWRVRGAAWQVRGEPGPMCDDFYRACALGDCEGLRLARGRGQCRPPAGGNGTDAPPSPPEKAALPTTTGTAAPAPDGSAPAQGAAGGAGNDDPLQSPAYNEHIPPDEKPATMQTPTRNDGDAAKGTDSDAGTASGPGRKPESDAGRKASLYELPDDSPAPRALP